MPSKSTSITQISLTLSKSKPFTTVSAKKRQRVRVTRRARQRTKSRTKPTRKLPTKPFTTLRGRANTMSPSSIPRSTRKSNLTMNLSIISLRDIPKSNQTDPNDTSNISNRLPRRRPHSEDLTMHPRESPKDILRDSHCTDLPMRSQKSTKSRRSLMLPEANTSFKSIWFKVKKHALTPQEARVNLNLDLNQGHPQILPQSRNIRPRDLLSGQLLSSGARSARKPLH